MMTSTPLVQEPRPTLVGERVNSQGSRKAKELLLADDYDGIVQVAEDQVTGGAHVLDLCVALTERQDEDEQMAEVAQAGLADPAGAAADRLDRARGDQGRARAHARPRDRQLGQPRGRPRQARQGRPAGEGARRRADRADDRRGRDGEDRPSASSRSRQRIKELACDEHGLDPELLIFDALTFTLTTGDDEWQPSAVETIEGIRRIKAEIPGVKTSLGVSNVSFGVGQPARAVLNSVFLHHCVEAGLDLAMVNPNHITPYSEIPENERELADDLVYNRREDALERFIEHFESKGPEEAERGRRPDRGHGARGGPSLAHPAPQEGGGRGLDRPLGGEDRRGPDAEPGAAAGDEGGRRQVRRRRADPAVRPPVGRGDEARRRPARELPRPDRGPHQGQGRDRDRVRRRPRHRQVARQHDPDQQRLHGRRPRQAGPDRHDHRRRGRARGRRDRALGAARLDLEADARLHPGAAPARARVPGADRRRRDQPRLRPPRPLPARQGVRRGLRAGRLLLQGRVRRARHGRRADRRGGARGAGREDPRRGSRVPQQARSRSTLARRPPTTRCARAAPPTTPIPEPPFWGVREIDGRPRRGLSLPRPPRALQAPLGRARQEGRGVAPDRRGPRRRGGLRAEARAHVARAGLPAARG